VVETDASDAALSAPLNQRGRPVASFSRTVTNVERNQSSVEQEAAAIVEAIRKWNHFLLGLKFTLITDQQSVRYMYDTGCKRGKIKNAKILLWRLELAELNFDVVYRAGKYYASPDYSSRLYCSSFTEQTLYDIHAALCHPGVTRMIHFVKTKNLPYSVEDVRKMIAACRVFSEMNPGSTNLLGYLW